MSSIIALAAVGCSASVSTQKPIASPTLRPYLYPTTLATSTTAAEAPTVETTPRPTATPFTHTIQKDETLLVIAARYGISLEMLLAANPGINPRLLSIGQQLTIPGPEGGQLIPELPTTTPVPVQLSDVGCFPRPSQGITCLATVSNPGDEPVEGVVVGFTVFASDAQAATSIVVYTPLNLLLPGGTLPVSASFSTPSDGAYTVRATLLSAIAAAHPEERYADVTLSEGARQSTAGKTSWTVSGEVEVAGPPDVEVHRLVVLAMGFDSAGAVVGFAESEIDAGASSNGPIAYTLRVFSLGPPIADVQVVAEASTAG